jgi:transposase-like protein
MLRYSRPEVLTGMKTTRKRYSPEFKAKVALERPVKDRTLVELTAKHGIQHDDLPWYCGRQRGRHLQRDGHEVGRRRVRRLMTKVGLSAIY